ncbi:MAG: hypothetical protein ACI9AF_000756 [Granulosicoccus sp.]
MVGGDFAHEVFPESEVVGAGEEVNLGIDDGPGLLFELVFELILCPSGVPGESFDEGAGLVEVGLGFIGRDAGGEAEFGVAFPEGGEGELVAGDWPAEVDGEFPELDEVFVREKVADGLTGGVVEDEAKGSFFGGIFGEEDDGLVEVTIAKGGVSDEDFFLEFGGGRVGVHRGRMNGRRERVKKFPERWISFTSGGFAR